MKKAILVLRKIRREVGVNVARLFWAALRVVYQTNKPAPRAVRRALDADRRALLRRLHATDVLLDQARFFDTAPSDEVEAVFASLQAMDREDRWQWTSLQLARLATLAWGEGSDPGAYLAFLHEKEDAYFRYHELNRGENDHWEWYLVPWHRTYGRLAVALLDPRLRPLLLPIWRRYDRWYRAERPWMIRLVVGSNISAAQAGYTLHALLGFLLHDDVEAKRRYLDDYVRRAQKLHRALDASFDVDHTTAVPLEGILYGAFWFRTGIILGAVQRALGLQYTLFDTDALRGLARYVWTSRTPDGDYQTSGDARAIPGHVPEQTLFTVLAQVRDDAHARSLVAVAPAPDFLTDRIRR